MRIDQARWWTLMLPAVALVAAGALILRMPAGASTTVVPEADRTGLSEMYGRLPLHFEANRGQSDPSVKFLSRGPGYGVYLTPTEVVLVLSKSEHSKADPNNRHSAVVRMQLLGANAQPEVTGVDELPGKTNYFLGKDPANWRTNVPTYAKVRYRDVYSGIDSIYYGNGRQLEYDFLIAPGADPKAILLGFDGSERVSIDEKGDLVLQAGNEEIRLLKPVAYQQVLGNRREIPVEYVLRDGQKVAFDIGPYDEREPLVIDPVISYATYLGGTLEDIADGIVADGSGNAYITGGTFSTNFPTETPLQPANAGGRDVFVAKLNADGSALLYSTYLGGVGDDYGEGIAIDLSGNAYITGYTASSDFPTANAVDSTLGGTQDAFLTKLNTDASALVYSTYLGGTGSEASNAIVVDPLENVYAAGNTTSTNFPTTVGALQPAFGGGPEEGDAFVAKLNAAGTAFVYATYLGGSLDDIAWALALDGSQNAYVVGTTASTNFPTTVGARQPTFGGIQDAFVSKLNAAGSALTYSTYHGGTGDDSGLGIAVDSSGNASVTGTASTNFPTANALQSTFGGGLRDGFVTKFNASGSAFVYSTYIGGDFFDSGFGMTVDDSGNAYVVGTTTSTNFPTANPTQPTWGGGNTCMLGRCSDVFVSKLNPSGSALLYSTYFGGNLNEFSRDIAVASGNIYIAGLTASALPTTNPLQPTYGGGTSDGFVAKISEGVLKKRGGQITSQ